MDKNVKKIISEAFNELYEEMIGEAPVAPTKRETLGISDAEIEEVVGNALRRGYDKRLAYDFASNSEQDENFNIAIDRLIEVYLTSKDEQQKSNAKTAIQAAFDPNYRSRSGGRYNKLENLFKKYQNRPDFKEMISDAFEQTLLQNFDKIVRAYEKGSGSFPGILRNSMNRKVLDNIKGGYTADKIDREDIYGGGSKGVGTISVDQPLGGDGKMTVGDKIGADDAPETEFTGNAEISNTTGKEIVDNILQWFAQNVNNPEYPEITSVRETIFREYIQGADAKRIWEENPEVKEAFGYETKKGEVVLDKNGEPKPSFKPLPQEFRRLTKSDAGEEISELISRIYKINFSLEDVDPTRLRQIYAMSPEIGGGFSKTNEKSSEEMLELQRNIKDALADMGYKNINVDPSVVSKDGEGEYKKFKKVFQELSEEGRDSEIAVLSNLLSKYEEAISKDKARGGYGHKTPYIANKETEESGDDFGGMFEGVDEKEVNKLMERVLRRLSE